MKRFCSFFVAIVAIIIAGCEGDPKEITLTDGQKSEVEVAYDNSSSSIEFEAVADWTATVTPVQRSSEVDWLQLDQTSGSAGAVTLTFTMDSNYTGERRSACIVITCNGYSVTITITQFPEGEDPETGDEDDGESDDQTSEDELARPMPQINMYCDSYYFVNGEAVLESIEQIHLVYTWNADGTCFPDVMIVVTDDVLEHTHYSSNWSFECSGSSLSAWTLDEDGSVHNATLKEGRVVSGSYSFDGGATSANYSIEYNSDGWISKTTRAGGSSYTFNWVDGNLTSISNANAGSGTFTYSEYQMPYLNGVQFDFNALLIRDEFVDFSTGDPSKIWAMFGYLGGTSQNLVDTYTSPDGITTDVEYTTINEYEMECIVVEWRSGEPITRTEWQIRCHGF